MHRSLVSRKTLLSTDDKSLGQVRLEMLQDDDNAFINLSSTLALATGSRSCGPSDGDASGKWKERKEKMRKKRARDKERDEEHGESGEEGDGSDGEVGTSGMNPEDIFTGSASVVAPARLNLTAVFAAEEQRADRYAKRFFASGSLRSSVNAKAQSVKPEMPEPFECVENTMRTFTYYAAARRGVFRSLPPSDTENPPSSGYPRHDDPCDYARYRHNETKNLGDDLPCVELEALASSNQLLMLCSVCLDPARYRCVRCTPRSKGSTLGSSRGAPAPLTQLLSNPQSYFCSLSCLEIHRDVRCNKHVA